MTGVFEIDTTSLADEGRWCHLKHPVSGAALPARVLLLGCDGERFRLLRHRLAARRREALLRQEEDVDAGLELELATHATIGWENVDGPDGAALPFSVDNARDLYRRRGWVLQQVMGFVADRANFLKASGTT